MGVLMCGEVCSAKMHFHSEPAFAAMQASLTPLVEFMYCAPPDKHASAGSCFCTTLTAKQPPTQMALLGHIRREKA